VIERIDREKETWCVCDIMQERGIAFVKERERVTKCELGKERENV
jgi:hypothetical protein